MATTSNPLKRNAIGKAMRICAEHHFRDVKIKIYRFSNRQNESRASTVGSSFIIISIAQLHTRTHAHPLQTCKYCSVKFKLQNICGVMEWPTHTQTRSEIILLINWWSRSINKFVVAFNSQLRRKRIHVDVKKKRNFTRTKNARTESRMYAK